ncbi:lactonase family protein [Pseudarthrobacter sp. P1]|uniref:lactonase family protein n=1 Tax=Pseudarthrobacter sp. P1 TaxID=3418418 RepID=UPI003CF72BF3
MTHALVGSYTEPGSGTGTGVSRLALAADGLIAGVELAGTGLRNPSFLASTSSSGGRGVLYAVEELDDGTLAALDPGTLTLRWRTPTSGSDPCHLGVVDGSVWVANYSSGTVAVLPGVDKLPGPVSVLLANPGSGPVADRQEGSHAHQVVPTGWGTVLVADLGADRVDEYLAQIPHTLLRSAQLPAGTGPRHVVLQAAGRHPTETLWVAGELDAQLHRFTREENGAWTRAGSMALYDAANPAVDAGAERYPSHLQANTGGTLLYAAIRGRNTIAVVDISGTEPHLVAEVDCGGNWPRHFAVGRSLLYVANQLSDEISVFALDGAGLPGAEPVQRFAIGSPTCILLPPSAGAGSR